MPLSFTQTASLSVVLSLTRAEGVKQKSALEEVNINEKNYHMSDLFDLAKGRKRKEEGMALAADNQLDWLQVARNIAVEIAKRDPNRCCNADAVGLELYKRHGITTLGPAAGSLFKEPHWEFTGQRVLSKRKSNHARELKLWRLVG